MKRVVGYAVGLGVLVMVLLSPAAFWNQSVGGDTANDEPTSITSYVADFTLADDGDLTATETITVDFPVPDRHGIFRFFDESDPSAPRARRIPEDVRVSMDGRPVDVEMLTEQHGRITVAKVGSADRFVPTGEHTYVITYRIDGVIEPGTTGETSQFYWNLIPSGWRQSIARSDLTVHLPAAGVGTGCLTGVGDAEQSCRVRGDGTDTLRVRTGRLEPNTPVTIKTGLDLATPAVGNEKPWAARYDRVLGEHLSLLLLVVLLGLGAAVLGAVAAARARESDPGFPLQYAPPDGIGPAQAAYLLTEQTDREAYVATLMYAAEKGAVDLEKSDGAWSISDKSGPAGWAGLDPVTSRVAHLLGGPGTSFTAAPTDVAAGKRLKDEIEGFESSTREWATSSGNMVSSGLGGLGSFLVLGAVAATIAILVWNPLSMTMLGVTGAFAVCAAPLLARGSGTKRTRAGRDALVARRRLPADPGDGLEQGPVRLLRPRGAVHGVHPVGRRVRLRRRVGREVPHRDGRRAAGAVVLRRLVRRRRGRRVRQLDGRRLLRHRGLRHLLLPGHPDLVVLRRRRRVLRGWRRWWRGRRLLVTDPARPARTNRTLTE